MCRDSAEKFYWLSLVLILGVGKAALSSETIFVPFARTKQGTLFSRLEVNPFETSFAWSSEGPSHAKILKTIDFVYGFLRTKLHFAEEEVAQLIEMDQSADAGTFAYIISFTPQNRKVRGALRLTLSRYPEKSFFPWVQYDFLMAHPLPMVAKYSKNHLGNYIEKRFPQKKKVEWNRLGCDHPTNAGRVHIMVQLVRAALLFLNEAAPDALNLVESAAKETTSLYESFGLEVDPKAPLPEGRTLLTNTVESSIQHLIAPGEECLYIPQNMDRYSDAASKHVIENFERLTSSIRSAILRSLGGVRYHQAVRLMRLSRFDEAKAEIEQLMKLFGEEPELLSLELELESRSRVNFWTGEGDHSDLRDFLESRRTRDRYKHNRLGSSKRWDERLFWSVLNESVAGKVREANRIRNEMAKRYSKSEEAGRGVLELLGERESLRLQALLSSNVPAPEIISHALFHHHVAPLGASSVFNQACATILMELGNPLANVFSDRAAAFSSP